MTSLDKLNVSQLPPHEAFFSTLKNENISAEDYQLCQRVWEDNDMKTMKEFLVWYNNKDVVPMLEAIEKMSFPLQPIDGHVFIPSGCSPPKACFFFSENEMSARHVLHD
jgi:hypothetical protein